MNLMGLLRVNLQLIHGTDWVIQILGFIQVFIRKFVTDMFILYVACLWIAKVVEIYRLFI